MTKLMDSESIVISMEPNMRAIGKKINNTETDLKLGRMGRNMKVNMSKVKNMELEDSHGLMEALTMVSL